MNPGSLLFVQAGFAMETVSTVLSIGQIIRLAFLAFLMRYLDRIEPMKLLTFTALWRESAILYRPIRQATGTFSFSMPEAAS